MNNTSFIVTDEGVEWQPSLDQTANGMEVLQIRAKQWNNVSIRLFDERPETEDDFAEIVAEESTSEDPEWNPEAISEAFDYLSKQQQKGEFEFLFHQLAPEPAPGELGRVKPPPCTFENIYDPRCCLNRVGRNLGSNPQATSTPKACGSSFSRRSYFESVSPVARLRSMSGSRPLTIDISTRRDLFSKEMGSGASSPGSNFSSGRSTRASSVSSHDDPEQPGPSNRVAPKRNSPSVTRGTQLQDKRRRIQEVSLVTRHARSPRTPGSCSPNAPEPAAMDRNQPSTSGPQLAKMCKGRVAGRCASECAKKGPCHEEMF